MINLINSRERHKDLDNRSYILGAKDEKKDIYNKLKAGMNDDRLLTDERMEGYKIAMEKINK